MGKMKDETIPEFDQNSHYPECPLSEGCQCPCICDRLRACEQRAYNEKHHDPGTRCDGCHSFGYDEGYAAGVQAARDAVATRRRYQEFSWGVSDSESGDWIHRSGALAAIDALLEERK